MRIHLIRHGTTPGNQKKRYIGATDEPLAEEGIAVLKEKNYPPVDFIYTSPMKRCVDTAAIIYPISGRRGDIQQEMAHEKLAETERAGYDRRTIDNFRELDFGIFENRNYEELSAEPRYQEWIDSGCTSDIPEGEHPLHFKERCKAGFFEVLADARAKEYEEIAIVVHGGVIMSLMESFVRPEKGFYDWYVHNGEGYTLEITGDFNEHERTDTWYPAEYH